MKRSRVIVDLDQFAHNLRALRGALTDPAQLMLVVKSDAYGHGLEPIVRTAVGEGVHWFAVSHLDEALAVRRQAPEGDILLLGTIEAGDVAACLEARVTPILVDPALAPAWSEAARSHGGRLSVHLKIDTGMGRFGWMPGQIATDLPLVLGLEGLHVSGICSHLATVEPDGFRGGDDPAVVQGRVFHEAVQEAEALSGRRLFRHLSSSRAAQFHPELDLDAIRPGIVAYGYGSTESGMRVRTRPCLEWRAPVAQVRDVPAGFPVGYYSTWYTEQPTRLAVLSVGYADGLLRALSNHGRVLVGGRRCRLVGRVSMNLTSIDVGADAAVQVGDEAVLVGAQGDETLWANEMAREAGTIAYEILTAIRTDLPREYVGG